MNKSFFVQRQKKITDFLVWVSEEQSFSLVEEAKLFANQLEIGPQPEPLRIVDEKGTVRGWVSRNGWLPKGGLAPDE